MVNVTSPATSAWLIGVPPSTARVTFPVAINPLGDDAMVTVTIPFALYVMFGALMEIAVPTTPAPVIDTERMDQVVRCKCDHRGRGTNRGWSVGHGEEASGTGSN
jgi:hypothetical protein